MGAKPTWRGAKDMVGLGWSCFGGTDGVDDGVGM